GDQATALITPAFGRSGGALAPGDVDVAAMIFQDGATDALLTIGEPFEAPTAGEVESRSWIRFRVGLARGLARNKEAKEEQTKIHGRLLAEGFSGRQLST